MTSLTLVRRIKARPSVVFDAVTTAAGIAQWWGPDAGPVLIAEAGCVSVNWTAASTNAAVNISMSYGLSGW
jgi:uncharacterized protein YndB with AHSA1/START domain